MTTLRLRSGHALLLVLALLPSLSAVALGQDCPATSTIAADRPGNLTGPNIVPRGFRQLEVGWSHARVGDDRSETVAATLLRVGVLCDAELRLALGGWSYATSAAGPRTGLGDAWLGAKVRVAQATGWRPELALLGGALVPTHAEFSHHAVEPDVNLTAAWTLPGAQSLLAFAGAARRASGTVTAVEQLRGVSWSLPIGRAGAFVEYSELRQPAGVTRTLGSGLTLYPHATMQLDASVLVPLPRRGADAMLGVGLSRRW